MNNHEFIIQTIESLVRRTKVPVTAQTLIRSEIATRQELRKLEHDGLLKSCIVDAGKGTMNAYYTEGEIPDVIRHKQAQLSERESSEGIQGGSRQAESVKNFKDRGEIIRQTQAQRQKWRGQFPEGKDPHFDEVWESKRVVEKGRAVGFSEVQGVEGTHLGGHKEKPIKDFFPEEDAKEWDGKTVIIKNELTI